MSNDEAYDLIVAIATGERDDVDDIAEALDRRTKPRRR
jgi:hypothetical protein